MRLTWGNDVLRAVQKDGTPMTRSRAFKIIARLALMESKSIMWQPWRSIERKKAEKYVVLSSRARSIDHLNTTSSVIAARVSNVISIYWRKIEKTHITCMHWAFRFKNVTSWADFPEELRRTSPAHTCYERFPMATNQAKNPTCPSLRQCTYTAAAVIIFLHQFSTDRSIFLLHFKHDRFTY